MTRNWATRVRANLAARSPYLVQAAARNTVHRAIRTGDLTRESCEVCGTTDRVHGHHEDYSKPLEVRWLCFLHHRWLHAYGLTVEQMQAEQAA